MRGDDQKMPLRLLLSPFTAVTVKLYSIAPQILLSLQKDNRLNERYFNAAKDNLRSVSSHLKIDSFLDLRLAYLNSHHCIPIH
jgi:hypothetical protein